ncbi:hypothetical protein QEJ31_04150 [Pigmentibacter sp. JX0631]|uniref:hypothetical protein n=1 Tax=Pigmentibacter sp. JX0631 TaxID=2976982 RepID=UPI0024687F7E|nr:hypothetical protein [Pigmentibacter sp. JX0631]WGL60787.1 hypothetical protein QEJ31_04150 [Pigmentibacter sp. JX0631]
MSADTDNTQNIEFENHFALKVVVIYFPNGYHINSEESLNILKNAWSKNLKSWHSPYTCLFDLRNFTINSELELEFEKLIKFFKNFFMRKIIGFYDKNSPSVNVSFDKIEGFEEAASQTGLARANSPERKVTDLRSKIQFDNDFNAHVMEISFLSETELNTKEDLAILKSKLQNNLMLWHTPYSIIINCLNLSFSAEAKIEFNKINKFLSAFFCKKIVGYAPKGQKDTYPFLTYRSRHLAAGSLENEGLEAGDKANCSTRKIGT